MYFFFFIYAFVFIYLFIQKSMNWLDTKEVSETDEKHLYDEYEHAELQHTLKHSHYADKVVRWLLKNLEQTWDLWVYSSNRESWDNDNSENFYEAYRALIENKPLTDKQWIQLLRFLHGVPKSLHPQVKAYADPTIQKYQERLKRCIESNDWGRQKDLKDVRKQFNENFEWYSSARGKFLDHWFSEPGEHNPRWRADNVRDFLNKKLNKEFVPAYLQKLLAEICEDHSKFAMFVHGQLITLLEDGFFEESERGKDSIESFLTWIEGVSAQLGNVPIVKKILKWLVSRFEEDKEYAGFIARIKKIQRTSR